MLCHRLKRQVPVLETCWALGVRPAQMHSAILVPTSCALKQFRASRLVQPLPASCFLYHTCLYQTYLYQICLDSTCGYLTLSNLSIKLSAANRQFLLVTYQFVAAVCPGH